VRRDGSRAKTPDQAPERAGRAHLSAQTVRGDRGGVVETVAAGGEDLLEAATAHNLDGAVERRAVFPHRDRELAVPTVRVGVARHAQATARVPRDRARAGRREAREPTRGRKPPRRRRRRRVGRRHVAGDAGGEGIAQGGEEGSRGGALVRAVEVRGDAEVLRRAGRAPEHEDDLVVAEVPLARELRAER
jgi:hypothetical protein